MPAWKIIISHCILSICLALFPGSNAQCSLENSVRKYKNHVVSQEGLDKLAKFDHLIRYFSSFAYFVPRHKVSPDFIRALILAESSANPKAVSNRDALGLGQIILTTGSQAAKELSQSTTHFRYVSKKKLANLNKNDLLDPAVNILLTCYLISKYNYRFNGKIDLVLTAWNAGENTESLTYGRHAPYRETEDLIGKVNAYFVFLLKKQIFR